MSASARARRGTPAFCFEGVADEEQLVTTVDTLVDGVHFPHDTSPEDVGYKALAVNLSDLASMGAIPLAAVVNLCCGARDIAWGRAIEDSVRVQAHDHALGLAVHRRHGESACVSVLAMGRVTRGTALRRDGAQIDDDLWVSGTLGEAGAALATEAADDVLVARLRRPVPRLALGQALRGIASSAIDVSDGLCGDVAHLCERSHVGARIDAALLPLSPTLIAAAGVARARALALSAGDDYELAFTASRALRAAVLGAAERAATRVSRVGHIVTGNDVRVRDGQGRWRAAPRAYQHFRGEDD